MARTLEAERVASLFTDGVEQVELTESLGRNLQGWRTGRSGLTRRGARCKCSTTSTRARRSRPINRVSDADASGYDGLVIPGGVANPDRLRSDADAVRFVRDFLVQDKPVGIICHGPWMLVETGVAKGRTVTSWPSLQTDPSQRRRDWVDREVVIDNGLVTSRKPDDLPAFCAKVVEELAEGRHE